MKPGGPARSRVPKLYSSGTAKSCPISRGKHISFAGGHKLELFYRLENRGALSFRYMWSAHPLISVGAGFELILPPANPVFRTFPFDNESYIWPDFGDIHLSRSWVPEGTNLKIFVTGLSEGWCGLRQPRATLRCTLDLSVTPILGLWFNNLGFPAPPEKPFRCTAVEPCTSASDLLDELPPDAYPPIDPGAATQWSLALQISTLRGAS